MLPSQSLPAADGPVDGAEILIYLSRPTLPCRLLGDGMQARPLTLLEALHYRRCDAANDPPLEAA